MIKRPIHMSHDFLAEVLDDESIVVDATMGNGNDSLSGWPFQEGLCF